MYRPTPNFVLSVAVLLVIAVLLLGSAKIIATAQQHALDRVAENALAPSPRQDWRPNIRHCFIEGMAMDLWDCIRHAEID